MIRATIPAGMTEATVNGLHQWDYGQKLVIESEQLPSMTEVHFSCGDLKEADVRVGSGLTGAVTVSIPDHMLEQSGPITAWVYAVDDEEATGTTIMTLTLPVIARARPKQPSRELPAEISDKYTEALTELNTCIEELRGGDVKVSNAATADYAWLASHAKTADNASKAGTADEAGHANTADEATEAAHAAKADEATKASSASTDVYGFNINNYYLRPRSTTGGNYRYYGKLSDGVTIYGNTETGSVYMVVLEMNHNTVKNVCLGLLYWDGASTMYSQPFDDDKHRIKIERVGTSMELSYMAKGKASVANYDGADASASGAFTNAYLNIICLSPNDCHVEGE